MKGVRTTRAIRNETVGQELADMASHLLENPVSHLRRTALVRAVADLIRTGKEQHILEAVDCARNLESARLIRQAAETASQSVCLFAHGVEVHSRVLTVPLVVSFPETITEQDFEDALGVVSRSAAFIAGLRECGKRENVTFVLPYFYSFDDLIRLPFNAVQTCALLGATNGMGAPGLGVMPFPQVSAPRRRSRTFLRYLVGLSIDIDPTLASPKSEKPTLCVCVRDLLRKSVAADPLDVVTPFDGHFYEAMFRGLRTYQARRIAEIATDLRDDSGIHGEIAASVSLHGDRQAIEARLAFFSGGDLIRHHTYRTQERPLDEPQECANRLVGELKRAGIRRAVTSPQVFSTGQRTGAGCGVPSGARALMRTPILIPL